MHFIRARLGASDPLPSAHADPNEQLNQIDLVSGQRTLGFGLGRVIGDAAQLGLAPSETGLDLLILAALVYAADTRISRKTFSSDSWTREIHLELPVADPALWISATPLILRMLRFLSGDIWQLSFRPRPRNLNRLIPRRGRKQPTYDGICLFSGGLDSFIGAIDLVASGNHPLLISHASEGATSDAQNKLFDVLRKKYSPIDRLRFWIAFPQNLFDQSGGVEESMRARSFLFFSAAAFAASSFPGQPETIWVPENGLISLNVPLDPLRLGSLSTRTTHPFYLTRWNELLARLSIPARLDNPYQFETKGEMAAECADQQLLLASLSNSMSCSSPTKGRWRGRPIEHCGYCIPCLIRRAAIAAAFGADPTPYTLNDLHNAVLSTESSEGRQVRSFQFAAGRLRSRPAIATALIHKPGPLTDWYDRLDDFSDLYRRGISEVDTLLANVTARPT